MARKNRTLPFVVKPRLAPIEEEIGSELSGTIKIERRGYLSVAEKAWVQVYEAGDDSQGALYRLAVEIGSDLSMEPGEVFKLISTQEGNQDPRITPYASRLLSAIQEVNASQERRKYVMATCLIHSRIDPKWELEDTMDLHPDILNGLADLFADEEVKSIQALEAAYEEKPEETEKVELGKD